MPVDHSSEDEANRVPVGIAVENKAGELDFGTLKTGGIIKQRQKDLFTVRLKCPGGRMTLDRLAKIVEVARKYGGDYVHLSVRQSVEIPYVNYRDVAQVQQELAAVGQEIASCGARVRVPTACAGCEYNPNGLTETQKMAAETADRFFGQPRPLPHKFKIVFAGCPIDCPRASSADLSFQGAVRPTWEQEACIGCRICAEACQEGAIESDDQSGEPIFRPEKCLYCGDCIRNCPTEAWRSQAVGWIVRVGGKHGRHPILSQRIAQFVPDEKVPEIVEAVLQWYERNGAGKGRVRIGALLTDEATWQEFLEHMKPVLGSHAIPGLPPPRPIEIHF